MKVVFVLPPYDYSRSVGSTRKKVQIGLLPPLGVGYLAASVEAHGHSAALVDAVAEQLDAAEAAAAVAAYAPDAVGISSFTAWGPNDAYAMAKAIRARLPETPIIMGGPHVTSFADAILDECPEVDLLIPGDAEHVLAEVIERMAAGTPYDDVRGILYRAENGEIMKTPPAEVIRDIDQFPHPARHIYKQELYSPLPSLSSRRPVTSIITARGCPWARCKFCYQGGEHAVPYRRRSPENVVAEIRDLVQAYGIRNLVVWDDNFCVRPKWIEKFCTLLRQERLGVIWSVLSRVDTVTPDMFRHMASAGCYSVQFGIESGCPELLELINKGHTLEQCRQAVRWAKKAGLETRAFFILGFPTETPEMSRQTVRFACELNIDYVVFFSYHLAPGTALEALALREGTRGPYTAQQRPSYVPNTYASEDELAAMITWGYRAYYLRGRYVTRALWRLFRKPSLLKNHLLGFYYWLGLMASK